jgi:hypothetical protein
MGLVTVQVWDATGNKRQDVEIPDDAPMNRILAVLLEKMNPPANSYWTPRPSPASASGMVTFCGCSRKSRLGEADS